MNPATLSSLGPFLVLLALAGGAALVLRLGGSLVRLGLTAAETTAATGLAEVSARRGDLTGLAERREEARALRRARRRQAAATVLWISLLVAPAALGWAREVYAGASLLWLLPRPRLRLPRAR